LHHIGGPFAISARQKAKPCPHVPPELRLKPKPLDLPNHAINSLGIWRRTGRRNDPHHAARPELGRLKQAMGTSCRNHLPTALPIAALKRKLADLNAGGLSYT